MIRREWLRYYDRLPERTYRTEVIQSWDTAAKDGAQNDWSVCTTWMIVDDHYYLIDLTRGRYEYPRLKETAIALAKQYRPRCILIEDASTGTALAQELKMIHFGGATRLVPIERDKIGRLYVNQAKFEAGLVLFPRKERHSCRSSRPSCLPSRKGRQTTRSIASAKPCRTKRVLIRP